MSRIEAKSYQLFINIPIEKYASMQVASYASVEGLFYRFTSFVKKAFYILQLKLFHYIRSDFILRR